VVRSAAEAGKNRYKNCNVAGSFISGAGTYLIALARIKRICAGSACPSWPMQDPINAIEREGL